MCCDNNMQRILKELGGISEATYLQFVEECIAQSLRDIRTVRASMHELNADSIAKTLHSIKGAAGNLRLEKVRLMAMAIEAMIKKDVHASALDQELAVFEQMLCAMQTKRP